MNASQKYSVEFGIMYATRKIQEIEAGTETVYEKWHAIDRQLLMMLDDIVKGLPNAYRARANACLEARKRVRQALDDENRAYMEALNKETSPVCLPAQDSL